ncbi:MAG: hypothetical protein V4507_10865 [Verrucomicrobiota bacterium]
MHFGSDQITMFIALIPAAVGAIILGDKNASPSKRKKGFIFVGIAVAIAVTLFF